MRSYRTAIRTMSEPNESAAMRLRSTFIMCIVICVDPCPRFQWD
ncbi:hypothetical protein SAMCFNEI73_Ch0626 [Sinorhizobium americanum]|uniref:Uncharacterized protein n=1 Tax=Sinorhizobium americanum TaxID=194963 RepID=A0A1L3LIK3_9HYPH|nr:hypothetical protein SAMCFNEI73_Ch0626 [Sinorhizobium americanum]